MTSEREYRNWDRGVNFVLGEPKLEPLIEGKVLARPVQPSTLQRDGWRLAVGRARAANAAVASLESPISSPARDSVMGAHEPATKPNTPTDGESVGERRTEM